MEIEISGNSYSIGKMSAMQQFHIARRLAPAIWALSSVAGKDRPEDDSTAINALQPVAEMLSKMSDEDSEYIVKSCLAVVQRKQQNGWAKVQSSNGGLMFDDINMQTMLQITFAVVKDNLGNFFNAR